VLEIRRYHPQDRSAVWELHYVALDGVGANLGDGARDDDLRRIEEVYLEDGGEFLVRGILEGKIVAMGALKRLSPVASEIKRMRVMPGYQGRSFGQQVLRAAALGYRELRLDTKVQQVAAQRLYEKNDCRETSRNKVERFDCIFYRKRLGR
jgi:ribosomal protein S18 acetylase RimI-like enzyme